MNTSGSEADLSLNSASFYFDNPEQFSGLDEGIEKAIHMYQKEAKHNKEEERNKEKE